MSSIADGRNTMNAHADAATANRFVTMIEDTEAKRLGITINEARTIVARRLRAPPGTLETIRRFRKKVVPNWLMARIRAELVATLNQEMMRLSHEIDIARQAGFDNRDDVLAAAAAQLATAKQILTGT